ncbi:MAG: hypothetical protein KatS3mg115_1857 [Candidatus Poribacteria bacterium]|nr:MAG: hypothetical protein KatS3mg115_1857 [Candidatus Poribacteria bacterium]
MVEVGSAVKLSVSGYRARVGEGFTPESCLRFANAFAAFLAQSGGRTVVLGRDTRPSGLAAFHAVLSGLLASGLSVHDAQVAPTPTVFYAAARLEADGALMITASHNPPDWNGIEAASRSGRLLNGSEREQLHRLFYAQSAAYTRWDEQGVCSPLPHAVDQHLEAILELPFVDLEAVRGAGFRVVVDAGQRCWSGQHTAAAPAARLRCGPAAL